MTSRLCPDRSSAPILTARVGPVIEYADQAAQDRDQLRVENDVQMRDVPQRWRELLDGSPAVEAHTVGS